MPDENAGREPFGGYHDAYPMVMGGAQRRPAMPVGTPAVTQHLAFWIPVRMDKRREWVGNVQQFISGLHEHLDTVKVGKDALNAWGLNIIAGESVPESQNRYPAARFVCFWETMPVRIGIELHREYFTLTTAIDLSKWENGWRIPDRELGGNAAALKSAVKNFNAFATGRYDKAYAAQTRIKGKWFPELLQKTHQTIYKDIWKNLYGDIYQAPFDAIGKEKLGGAFADLRSFAISHGDRSFVAFPYEAPSLSMLDKPPFSKREYLAAVEAIQPFVALSGERKELEYTFSRLLDGRYLYASALGAEPEALKKTRSR
jgi:hypothetical protein